MDIALLQMAQPRMEAAKPARSSSDSAKAPSSFDKMLHDTVATSQAATTQTEAEAAQVQPVQKVAEEVVEMAEAPMLKDVLDLLGIDYDESMLFINLEGQMMPMEEMMTLENLTAMLGVTPEQLESIMQQLLGQEAPLDDAWAMLEQAPTLLAQVTSILKGESTQVTPKEAAKVAEFLKLAQMVGMKTDTAYQQEFQLTETKNALQSLVIQLQPVQQETAKPVLFQQVVQQVTSSQTQVKQEVDTTQVQGQQQQNTPVTPKTMTITLPAERSAQSEALAKEIQNLINRSQLSNSQGTMRLVLKLFPENLGQIRIEVMQKDGMMQARLLATTASGKELLDSNLHQLKTAFAAQNIQMERIDVAQALQDAERSKEQGFFNGFFRQQQDEQEEKNDDEEQQSFEEFLAEEFFNEEV
ncbi:MAG: flagellar hook-length control protein FliK [Lysinibacillus sp.]